MIAAILCQFSNASALYIAVVINAGFLVFFLVGALRRPFRPPVAPALDSSALVGFHALTQSGLWFDALFVCPLFSAAIISTRYAAILFVLGALLAAGILYTLASRRDLCASPAFWSSMRATMLVAGTISLALLAGGILARPFEPHYS